MHSDVAGAAGASGSSGKDGLWADHSVLIGCQQTHGVGRDNFTSLSSLLPGAVLIDLDRKKAESQLLKTAAEWCAMRISPKAIV
jgi:hypothetical protein